MDVLENKKHGVKHDPTSGEKTVEALVRWEDHEASWLRGTYDPQSGEKTRAPLQDEEKAVSYTHLTLPTTPYV